MAVAAFAYPLFERTNYLNKRLVLRRPLRIPPLLTPRSEDCMKVFALTVESGVTELLPRKPTATLGFNGGCLGPTLRARQGDAVRFEITNALDETVTVHWHGMELPAAMSRTTHRSSCCLRRACLQVFPALVRPAGPAGMEPAQCGPRLLAGSNRYDHRCAPCWASDWTRRCSHRCGSGPCRCCGRLCHYGDAARLRIRAHRDRSGGRARTGPAFVAATTTAMSNARHQEAGIVSGVVSTFHGARRGPSGLR